MPPTVDDAVAGSQRHAPSRRSPMGSAATPDLLSRRDAPFPAVRPRCTARDRRRVALARPQLGGRPLATGEGMSVLSSPHCAVLSAGVDRGASEALAAAGMLHCRSALGGRKGAGRPPRDRVVAVSIRVPRAPMAAGG